MRDFRMQKRLDDVGMMESIAVEEECSFLWDWGILRKN